MTCTRLSLSNTLFLIQTFLFYRYSGKSNLDHTEKVKQKPLVQHKSTKDSFLNLISEHGISAIILVELIQKFCIAKINFFDFNSLRSMGTLRNFILGDFKQF